MSSQTLVLALVLITLFVMVSADTKAVAGPTVVAATPAPAEATGISGTVESPVGSVGAGAAAAVASMNSSATGQPPSGNGATTAGVSSAIVGAAAIAGYFVF